MARFRVSVDALHSLTGTPQNTLALSPDGSTLVYAARGGSTFQLYERKLEQLDDFSPIPGTEGGGYPVFSPDGTRLAYTANGRILTLRVPFTDAPPIALGEGVQSLSVIDWLSDTALVGTANDGRLERIGLNGSVALLARPDSTAGERNLFVQTVLPGGQVVLVTAATGSNVTGRLVALDTRNGRRVRVLDTDVNRAWYANGYLVYGEANGALQAIAFDARRLRVTGSAVTLAERVRQAIGAGAQAAVSVSGTLVYQPEQPFSLMLLDRTGHQQVVAEGHRFHSPRFSPDGRRLAFDFIQDGVRDVWTFDLRQGTLSRLSFEKDGHDPVWSRDGRWIYYDHASGTWRRRADGSGPADSVYTSDAAQALELTPNGTILGAAIGSNGQFDLVTLSADSPHTLKPLLATPYTEEAATLSPNGRWLAYTSDETGRAQVYVRQYPDGGAKVPVSQGTGVEPRWSPDGRTLYYEGERDGLPMLIAASVVAGTDFTVTARTPLFDISLYEPASPHANWDVSPDGSRFVMVNQGVLTQMVFIMNWPEEVRRQNAASGRSESR